MKQLPILFSTPMVQAILEGRKTQTRRIVKPQPDAPRAIYSVDDAIPILGPNGPDLLLRWNWRTEEYHPKIYQDAEPFRDKCPYGTIGGVLWIRESWALTTNINSLDNWPNRHHILHESIDGRPYSATIYRADGDWQWCDDDGRSTDKSSWKPSIHMPYAVCRIFLRITDIRVERLQDITEEDAQQEGITEVERFKHIANGPCWTNYKSDHNWFTKAVTSFRSLWEKINGPDSWAANSWCWVVSFERINKPE